MHTILVWFLAWFLWFWVFPLIGIAILALFYGVVLLHGWLRGWFTEPPAFDNNTQRRQGYGCMMVEEADGTHNCYHFNTDGSPMLNDKGEHI